MILPTGLTIMFKTKMRSEESQPVDVVIKAALID